MASLKDIVIDCPKPSSLARFWEQVLDDYDILPYDAEEIARLASLGLTPETDTSVIMAGPGPRICFQQVPEGKTVKNRMHLDLIANDRVAEVQRLVSLGATVHHEGDGWTTLLDPEGNEFCLMNDD